MADTVQEKEAGNPKLAKSVISRYSKLAADRDSFYMPSWRSAAEWIVPRKSSILGAEKTPGESGWVDNLYDLTASKACERLAAWLMSNTSPRNARWFAFTSSPSVRRRLGNASTSVQQWWQHVTEVTAEALQASNFYTEKHEALLDRNWAGTCAMGAFKGRRKQLNFRNVEIGTFVIASDDEGYIDTLIREFKLTAKQASQQFGRESLGRQVLEALDAEDGKKQDKEFTFYHSVAPNLDRDPSYADSLNKPWKSCYVCKEDETTVQEGGFDEMPYAVSRFLKWTGDTWGWAPAFTALPTIRSTNFFKMQANALLELMAFPPMAEPDSMAGVLDLRAGGRNVYDSSQPDILPKPLYQVQPQQLNAVQFMLESDRKDINDCFYGDVIAMFSNLEREVTAFEAAQLLGEKLDVFGPYYDREITELDSPTLQRVFSILLAEGAYDDPPPELLEDIDNNSAEIQQPDVVYLSRLALAVQAHEVASFDQLLQRYQLIASVDPVAASQFLKPIDLERASRGLARNLGVPVAWQRSDAELAALNAAEAEAAEEAANVQAAPQLAKAAKDIDSMSPNGKNRLASLAQSSN